MRTSNPPVHPILGHLPALNDDPLAFLIKCSRDHGAVVPVRIPFLRAYLLTDPADIERVLVTEHRKFIKPLWLRTPAVRRLLGDGLVNSDGPAWKRQHDECQPAFQPALMDNYGATMSRIVERTLSTWKVGETRNIQRDMARLTLEIVAETMFGANVGERAAEIGDAMDTVMDCFSAKSSLFGLTPLPPSRRELQAVKRLDALVDDLTAVKESTPDATTSVCPHLTPRLTGSRKEIRDQVKTILAAGHESSALTLTWAFLLLAEHPEYDDRLALELKETLHGRPPSPDDLPNLPITQAIVKESLRLYPPLWMTGRNSIEPIELSGVKIPSGSLLLTSQWAVQRLPKYFPEPDAFRPDRWLNDETASLPRFAYFPFGGGPRICIGQTFAMMESILILASIAQRFKRELVDGNDASAQATMTLRPRKNLIMRVAAR